MGLIAGRSFFLDVYALGRDPALSRWFMFGSWYLGSDLSKRPLCSVLLQRENESLESWSVEQVFMAGIDLLIELFPWLSASHRGIVSVGKSIQFLSFLLMPPFPRI